ncbi:MAG: VWA domain-containing protein [Terracidiphilus sp.]|jgi:VWFA-related protein
MVRSRMVLGAILLALPLAAAAQATAQAVASTPEHEKKASATEQQGDQLRLEVRRVPVDVVVTDKQGNAVRGLRKADFVVKEDKTPQTVLSFDYFDGSKPSFVPHKLPALPPNTYISLPGEPERGPLYVLYYDMVNTWQDDQMSFHEQLLDFVDKATPGTRMALFVNAAGLHLIQGFTSDHALLRAAILSKGPGPHLPKVFLGGVTRWGPGEFGGLDAVAALSNLKFIAQYLNGIPGRKNLLWLSSLFPIPVGPTSNALTYLLSESIQETYAALEASQVALCPVDVHGVDNSPAKYDIEREIAKAAGGHAYYANNRATQLLDKAVKDGESYYSLTYSPTNMKYDGSERHIEVTLAKKASYTLTYRTLYYGVPDDAPRPSAQKSKVLQARFVAAKAADTLFANIEHGAPMLHDLIFSAHLAAVGEPVLATAEQMAQMEDSPAFFRTRHKDRPLKPLPPVMLQKYQIDYVVIDPKLKELAARAGKPPALEFAAAAYDDDGLGLNSMWNLGLASAEPKANGKAGALFRAEQELEAPPGAAWIRLAVRDTLSDRTGTIEVRLPLKPEPITVAASTSN